MAAIFNGVTSLSTANYYQGAVNALPGSDVGFVVSLLFVVFAQTATVIKSVFNQTETSSSQGWELWLNSNNTNVTFGVGNGTANTNSPAGVITAGDVGRLLLATAVFDKVSNNIVRMYFKRVQVGSGTSGMTGSYVPRATAPAAIGKRGVGSAAADSCIVLGGYYALGIPSLAAIQAQHDAVMTTERMAIVPGFPGTLIDLTQDVAAAGGAVPATLTDRSTGGVTFARTGNPTLAPQYSRAWAW